MTEAECFCKKEFEAPSEVEGFVFINSNLHHLRRRFYRLRTLHNGPG
jgi:hypothetical protein